MAPEHSVFDLLPRICSAFRMRSLAILAPVVLAASCALAPTQTLQDGALQDGGQADANTAPGDAGLAADAPADASGGEWQAPATAFLERRNQVWIKNYACLTCHTTFAYLLARHALLPEPTPAADQIRRVILPAPMSTTGASTESVLVAAALAFDDMLGPQKRLSAEAAAAFETMWRTQAPDGHWQWFVHPASAPDDGRRHPWEARTDWGTIMAVMAAKLAGQDTVNAPKYRLALEYVKARYAATVDPLNLHDRIVVLWARSYEAELLSDAGAAAVSQEIASKQLGDGGFSIGTLEMGDPKLRAEAKASSDGYATAIATLGLLGTENGRARADVQRSCLWLAQNQRKTGTLPDDGTSAAGSWPSRSVSAGLQGIYMVNAATAYAAMALHACSRGR
jgi:hypothetical protein